MKQQMTIEKFLETQAYQDAKQVIFSETNKRQVPTKINGIWYSPISVVPCFSRVESVDYSCFKQSKGEKDLIREYKKDLPKTRTNKLKVILHEQF